MTATAWLAAVRDDAKDWTANRSPMARTVLLAYLAYAGYSHLASGLGGEYSSWFAGITLAFHELGHIVLAPAGQTLMLLGGSIFQLATPIAAGAHLLLKQRDWFGVSVCGGWLSTSLFELATYLDDANRSNLPLVGMGDEAINDWEVLLTGWHLLNDAQVIARATLVLAVFSWLCSLAFGGWLVLLMWRSTAGTLR